MTKSVFIVDDNCAMRQALCRLFNTAGGFQVCGQASSGAEAIQLIRDLRPDLIVLDLCMSGMNGLETARELQHLELPGQVILYSMNADEIAAQHANTAGIAALVSKAEGIKTLITKARIILDRSA
ncbi:MAG TPA: response regulator transcription factor [Pyrinomonadaceae bacterium]